MARAIKDVMTPDPVCVDPHDSAADAARRMRDAVQLMRERHIRRIPVVEEGDHPVGIVSIGDLAFARDEHSALADISAAPASQ
jgi:CBS domain-containing protein